MSIERDRIINALASRIPTDILRNLVEEYQTLKRRFALRQFQPSELSGGRFGECVVRLVEYLQNGSFTPFGSHIHNSTAILNGISSNANYPDSVRHFIPKLTRIILDVRNRRDVAHVGGEVSPNYSDAIFICHSADWILTELIRAFHNCPVEEAKRMVAAINQVQIPIVAEVDGVVRVQNTKLTATDRTLVMLYYKMPSKVRDTDLIRWLEYANPSRYKGELLSKLHGDAFIHYAQSACVLLPKGVAYVEKNISLEMIV
jgi:hypothetical protein